MNSKAWIKYILISLAVAMLGGLSYAAIKQEGILLEQVQEKPTETPVEEEVESTPTRVQRPTTTSVSETAPLPLIETTPLPVEELIQTPWRQGPSDQEPTPPGGGGSGSILPIEDVPWGQGPSDQ